MPSPESFIQSQANYIRQSAGRLLTSTDVGAQQGARSRMVTVELHMGELLYGLANLGMAMNTATMTALLRQGDEWVQAIRDFTPQGPESQDEQGRHSRQPRQLPAGMNWAPHQTSVPADSYSLKIWKEECHLAIKAARDQLGFHPSDNTDRVALDRAAQLIRDGYNKIPGNQNFVWGASERGSLWSSIGIRGRSAHNAGHVQMSAFSDNYYAGFVNDGFHHGLMPILRRQGSEGQLIKSRYQFYTTLPVARLGDYPIWSEFEKIMTTTEGKNDMYEGFSYDKAQNILTPGAGVVSFADRKGTGPWEPGHHMFEKGTAMFMTKASGKWRRDVDNIFRQAWDGGRVFHEIDRQFRVGKGVTGGNRPGTFAGL